ncbi:hypothetical protein Psi01_22740 [Planobispora siamensis]|uniref:Uncharacterized protein n=1 Tax=Planobispora siamensis TaxID=936338 RepID=A0A8J3SGJ7_9ACTN|nr:hypothetical protein Psi01_22740 [Planobispora siamensis]
MFRLDLFPGGSGHGLTIRQMGGQHPAGHGRAPRVGLSAGTHRRQEFDGELTVGLADDEPVSVEADG